MLAIFDFADGTRFTKYMSNRNIWIDNTTRTTKERRNASGTNAAVMPSSLGKKMSIAKPVPKIRPTKMGIHQALSGCGKIDGSRSSNTYLSISENPRQAACLCALRSLASQAAAEYSISQSRSVTPAAIAGWYGSPLSGQFNEGTGERGGSPLPHLSTQ